MKFLENDNSDTFWGQKKGNGGDWFELVVTEDKLDVRGWQFVISDDTGGMGETIQTLTLSNDSVWEDLRAGTIVTVSEDWPDDVTFDPLAGDWWINAQASFDIHVSNQNWQLTIRDSMNTLIFGPAGSSSGSTT